MALGLDSTRRALGTSTSSIMGITLFHRCRDRVGARARVEQRIVPDPQRRISELELVNSIPCDPGPEARAALELAAGSRPVCHRLGEAVGHPITWKWGA